MSDVQPVSKWLWDNQVHGDRIPYGSIPLDDSEIEAAPDRHSPESFREGSEIAQYWGDAKKAAAPKKTVKKAAAKKRGRPRKIDNA